MNNDDNNFSSLDETVKILKDATSSMIPLYSSTLNNVLSSARIINKAVFKTNYQLLNASTTSALSVIKNTTESMDIITKNILEVNNIINKNMINILPQYQEIFKEIKSSTINQSLESINVTLKTIDSLNNHLLADKHPFYNQLQSDPLDDSEEPEEQNIKPYNSESFGKELKHRLYNLSHNLIAPFSDKSEMAKWVVYFIIEQFFTSDTVPIQAKTTVAIIIAFYLSSDSSK